MELLAPELEQACEMLKMDNDIKKKQVVELQAAVEAAQEKKNGERAALRAELADLKTKTNEREKESKAAVEKAEAEATAANKELQVKMSELDKLLKKEEDKLNSEEEELRKGKEKEAQEKAEKEALNAKLQSMTKEKDEAMAHVNDMAPKLKQWEEVKQKTLNSKQNGDMSAEEELVLKQAHESMTTKVADLEAAATKRQTELKAATDKCAQLEEANKELTDQKSTLERELERAQLGRHGLSDDGAGEAKEDDAGLARELRVVKEEAAKV